jgi:hypothetical protein
VTTPKIVFSDWPIADKAAIAATDTKPAIRPYSTAVAPRRRRIFFNGLAQHLLSSVRSATRLRRRAFSSLSYFSLRPARSNSNGMNAWQSVRRACIRKVRAEDCVGDGNKFGTLTVIDELRRVCRDLLSEGASRGLHRIERLMRSQASWTGAQLRSRPALVRVEAIHLLRH